MNIIDKKLNLSSFSNLKQVELEKAYTEGIYCDSPANRKLGRVGMTYKAYAEKVKKEQKSVSEEKINLSFNISDKKTIPTKQTLRKFSLEKLKESLDFCNHQIDTYKKDRIPPSNVPHYAYKEFFQARKESIQTGEKLKKNIEEIIKEKQNKEKNSKSLDNESSSKKEEKSEEKKENNKKLNIDKILAKSDDLGKAKGKRLDAIISYAEFDNVPKNATDEEKRKIIAENYIKSAELSGTPEEIANDLDEIVEDAIADYVPPKKKDDTEERKKLSYIEARTVLNYSDTLANATTRQLNNVIDYSGFDIDKKLSNDEKREKLAQKYYASADLYELTSAKEVADALDGIIEDALEDYVPPKK